MTNYWPLDVSDCGPVLGASELPVVSVSELEPPGLPVIVPVPVLESPGLPVLVLELLVPSDDPSAGWPVEPVDDPSELSSDGVPAVPSMVSLSSSPQSPRMHFGGVQPALASAPADRTIRSAIRLYMLEYPPFSPERKQH